MNKIKDLFIKNPKIKRVAILVGVALGIFVITFILWIFVFSKYYIFHEQENKFLDAVKRYYEFREELLPKKGEIREVTLEKLFLENRIEDLTVPKSDKLCDTNSWVRVYHNEEGEYIYYTYLKCGRYESNIDHEGPKITLNGASEVVVNLGKSYDELGVKSVTDNVDGEMKVRQVEIDSSKVDTSKVGTYQVTYKVRDSLNNQTKVTRKVIVARNLTETVREATDESNYYKGAVDNNYLLFSGMLWRIINVNDDGSVKIISEDIVSNLRYDEEKYQGSNVEAWLNDVFYKSITNADKYVVDTTYCVGNITSTIDVTGACNEKVTAKVGLLSIDEFYKTVMNDLSSVKGGDSYRILLANKIGGQVLTVLFKEVFILDSNEIPPINPVITLKDGLYILGGDGSFEKPYKLNDYSYGKEHDSVSSRIVGEYINFSGLDFRIIGRDKGGNVKVIGAEPITTDGDLFISINDIENYQYDVTTKNNPGYILNNDYIEFLNDEQIIEKEYKIITNVSGEKYSEYETESVRVKVFLNSTVELFSGINKNSESLEGVQLFSDKTSASGQVIILNPMTGVGFELFTGSLRDVLLKPIFYLNGKLKISSGNGTANSPYIIK